MLVVYLPYSALTLVRASRSTASCSSKRLFRAQKAHGQQHQLGGPHLLGARHFLGHELAFLVALPLDLDGVDFLDVAVRRRR